MQFSRVALVASIFSAALFAQEFRSTISGVVTDPSGAPVVGAKVTATETRTGVKTPTVTDVAGKYAMPFLVPGNYEITAQAQGFKEARRTGLDLGADEHPVIDLALQVGDVSTEVSVSADVPLLNTDNASVGQSITTAQVEDIPLNGRTPLMLAQFSIGVTPTAAPTLVHPFDLGAPAAFSVAGTPSQASELLIDGVPDETWDGRAAYNPPVDAVQEVRVNAFDADASFGHTAGGTMNQVMKTGTNTVHGSAWEFVQPDTLTANDFFQNRIGAKRPVTHFNQWGMQAGGPVVLPHLNMRNKLFWFFTYEGLKDAQPNPTLLTVPTDLEKQGNFSQLLAVGSQYQLYDPNSAVLSGTTVNRTPIPGNIIPTTELNSIALNYMKLYPEPNVTVGVGATGTNNYDSTVPTTDNYNNEMGRLDYYMTDKNRMFFDVRNAAETQTKNEYFPNTAEGSLLFRDPLGGTLDDVYIASPTTVADVRINFTRLAETHGLPSDGFNPTTLGFPSNIAGNSNFLQMPVMGLTTFQALGADGASNYPSQSLQLFGDVVKTIGNHTIKFGVDARQYRMNFIVDDYSTGDYSFGNTWVRASSSASSTVVQGQDLASMLLGLPTAGDYDIESSGMFYNYYVAPFIQDDWRATRSLTITMGLHYDHDGAVHEKYGRSVNGFDTTDPNPIAGAAEAAYNSKPVIPGVPAGSFTVPGGLTFASRSNNAVFQNTSHLVSPRVGFAYSPDVLKGTVIRGGFGMFVAPVSIANLAVTGAYSTTPILAQEGFSQSTAMTVTNNNYVSPAATLSNPFPNGILQPTGSALGLATFNGQTVNFLNPKMSNPYSLRWDLAIQHTFGKNTVLEVAYVGNHAVHTPINLTQLNGIPRQYLSTLPTRDAAVISTLTGTVTNPFAGLLPNTSSLNGSTTALANILGRYPEFPIGDSSSGWSGSSGVLEYLSDQGRSYFDSLNVRVERRLSGGLSGIVNYGWSKLIEQDSWLNDSDPVPEKRISPFDHTQHIITALTYDLPIGKGRALNVTSPLLNAVVGGWHLNSVFIYQVGAPLNWDNGSTTSPGDYVFYGGAGSLPASFNNQETAIGANGQPVPAFNTGLFAISSANTFEYHIRTFSTTFPNIRQAPINEWDPSVLKGFYITEKAYLQLRFEFFNVLNHPNFAAPASLSATATTFGEITSDANRPRTIQLGARFVF